jgi:wyosine [tRNA(Phe)-imidazoG37] synthetase (radical SAM superfamily)
VGPTTCRTLKREEYQSEAIIRELEAYLASSPDLDVITLAGSGEPTLNRGLGRIIQAIKGLTDTPVAVLTNGALLFDPEVRRELLGADVVLPSLDTAREETFQLINRPIPGYGLTQLLGGLGAFRREYPGQVWLEVMILKGVNDQERELEALRRAISSLSPDKVQLNTAVRPVVEAWAAPVSLAELEAMAGYLRDGAEVIASFNGTAIPEQPVEDAQFLETLARRPMTAGDLAQVLGLSEALVRRRLRQLQDSGLIVCDLYQEEGFYRSTLSSDRGLAVSSGGHGGPPANRRGRVWVLDQSLPLNTEN